MKGQTVGNYSGGVNDSGYCDWVLEDLPWRRRIKWCVCVRVL